MTALQETSSEDLGFKLSTKPEGIRIFNDTIDFLEGDKNDLNLLSIGNLTGYFACSNMTSIVLDKLSLFETGEVAEGHELRRIENLTNVSQLTFNSDESKLYVVVDGKLKFIDMGQFEMSQLEPGILKDIKNIEDKYIHNVKAIHPSPGSPDAIGLINNSGELIVIDAGVARILHSGVSSFCWAKNGQTIYYGTPSSADVTAVSTINGDVQFKIENSAVSDPTEVTLISFIELESNFKWFAVYDRGEGEPEDHEYQIYIIQKTDEQTYEFYETDIAPPFGSVARFGTYYLLSLSNWSPGQTLVFVTSSLATEISTLFMNAEGNIESITQLNDSDRAQFPINDDTGDDASPIGLGLELGCLEYVVPEPCSGIDEAKGLPRLWCLTHEGTLISWWIFDVHGLKNENVSLERALDHLKEGVVIGSTKLANEKEIINDTKVSNSNYSAKSSGENQEQSINQPSSNLPEDKVSFGSSGFGTSKVGSTSSGAVLGSTGFGSTGFGSSGFGSNSSSTGTSAGSGFGSTGFGSSGFSKVSEPLGSSGFGESKKSSGFGSSGFGSSGFGSSGFGSSGFGSSGFGTNISESKNDNNFGNAGFGTNTTSSNGSKAAGGFG
ncbi:uncharacterized protein AC631_05889, partial [Debaryomyces fabryi]